LGAPPAVSPQVALFQPLIPGNTGAVGRLCVATGTPLHLVTPLGFSLDEARVRRAGLDYWPRLDLRVGARVPRPERGGRLLAFAATGGESLWEVALGPGDILLFGPEDKGLSPEVVAEADLAVTIPMVAGERSLNLAMAVAIALYEALRQTGGEGLAP